jgi:hypothetical protein
MPSRLSTVLSRSGGRALCLATVTAVLLTGCGVDTDSSEGDAFAPGSVQSTEVGPGTITASPTLPADFPADVAFPIGQYSFASVSDGEDVTTVVLDGSFDLDIELAHLVAAFEAAGYTVDQHTRAASGSLDQLYLELTGEERAISVAVIDRPEGGVATYEVTHHP